MPQLKEPLNADSPPKSLASWYAQGLSDGLGDRLLMFDNSDAPSLELLRFRPDLAQVPGFEAALREQVQRLGQFRHPAFAPVRSVQRLEPDGDLALISNCTPGKRLSEVLHRARGPAFAAALIKQLAPALAQLQQYDTGVSHGVLSPDRIVVSPEGRLTIVEHVVGPAIDRLNLRTAQLASIGIALPPAAGDAVSRLDVATDWYQLGLVAVSVLLGRTMTASDLPQLETLLDGLEHSRRLDGGHGLSPVMRQWLDRALQISGTTIESGADARAAWDELLQKDRPRDLRRVEPLRREQAAPLDPAPTGDGESRSRPTAFPPVGPVPVRPPTHEPSTLAVLAPSEARQPSPQVRTTFGAALQAPEVATAPRLRNPQATTVPRPRVPPVRARISTSVVAALALIAAVEAVAIVVMARALWPPPPPPITVETTASGDNMLVSSRWPKAAPLGVTVAPDLRWVRVTSRASAGLFGEKATTTPAGTIRITSPIELKVFEDSRLLGSVPGAALNIPPGRHDIELVNLALGYRLRQAIEVEAGQTFSIHVVPPAGSVTIDASPWAEVSIDGQAVGRTPLGPLSLAPGEHEFTFRHPAGGKDRQRMTVKSDEKTRVIGILRP